MSTRPTVTTTIPARLEVVGSAWEYKEKEYLRVYLRSHGLMSFNKFLVSIMPPTKFLEWPCFLSGIWWGGKYVRLAHDLHLTRSGRAMAAAK